MKKVKVLFSALAVVAVVAAAFAVKANPNEFVYLFNQQTGKCDIKVNATTVPNSQPLILGATATTVPSAPCTTIDLYVTQ